MRPAVVILLTAFALRLGFVLWAPGQPTGDGIFYSLYARDLALGKGYVNLDGSPAVRWMPGWPLLLAGVYAVFGELPKAGMILNAVLSALTAVGAGILGSRLVSERVGLQSGLFYACWPGVIYFCATTYTETLFVFLFVSTLVALLCGSQSEGWRRGGWFAASGITLGLCALVKAEPLALSLVIVPFLASIRSSPRELLRNAAIVFTLAGAVLLPWVVRNYAEFDRFIPTSASGGAIFHLGNHYGATGGNDRFFARAYMYHHRRATSAEGSIARNEAGWSDTWQFVRQHPREELRILVNKLKLTYQGDDGGADLVRGFGGPENWHVTPEVWERLASFANVAWFGFLALALLGLTSLRAWRREGRILVFGVLATWLLVHLAFLGGTRFHLVEVPLYAVLAACGTERLGRWLPQLKHPAYREPS